MKQRWLTLFFAGFLLLAPVVSADDGSVAGALQSIIDQVISLILGADPASVDSPGAVDNVEVGDLYPPHG